MTSKLNEAALANELAGSTFFRQPQPEKPAEVEHLDRSSNAAAPPSPVVADSTDVSTPPPPSVRPNGSPPVRRVITRYAFEFFQDQIEKLRRISLDQKIQGETGSMSEMVREAIDEYLSRKEVVQ